MDLTPDELQLIQNALGTHSVALSSDAKLVERITELTNRVSREVFIATTLYPSKEAESLRGMVEAPAAGQPAIESGSAVLAPRDVALLRVVIGGMLEMSRIRPECRQSDQVEQAFQDIFDKLPPAKVN